MTTHALDVRRMRYFLAVAEELHFGRAAERLHIAQPALSRQIALLEKGLGVLLFDRIRSRIQLTRAGEALIPHVRDILARIEEASGAARSAALGVTGSLSVGFVGSATYEVLPRILQLFRRSNPSVDLQVFTMNNAELKTALIERRLDVAFSRPGIADPEIRQRDIFAEPLVAILPADHPLAGRGKLALSELRDEPFILYPRHPRPSFADTVARHCRDAGFEPRVATETMDLQTALGLVAIGVGCSIVPRSVGESARSGIRCVQLSDVKLRTVLGMNWRRDNRSSVLRNFLDVANANAPVR